MLYFKSYKLTQSTKLAKKQNHRNYLTEGLINNCQLNDDTLNYYP